MTGWRTAAVAVAAFAAVGCEKGKADKDELANLAARYWTAETYEEWSSCRDPESAVMFVKKEKWLEIRSRSAKEGIKTAYAKEDVKVAKVDVLGGAAVIYLEIEAKPTKLWAVKKKGKWLLTFGKAAHPLHRSALHAGRIGPNQAVAVASLRMYAGAQNMYRRSDYDNDGIFEYAHPYTALNTQKDSKGRPIKLIDDALASAAKDGSGPAARTIPKAGYIFLDLTADVGGDAYDDGKGNFVKGYGLCAVPATYNRTGRYTYVINITGSVYMKDTGGKPVGRFPDVEGEGWAAAGG